MCGFILSLFSMAVSRFAITTLSWRPENRLVDILSLQFLSALGAIVVIDLMLAGDNAIVIALAARSVPQHLQKRAIAWGTVGAVAVRSVMTLAVVWLLKVPGLLRDAQREWDVEVIPSQSERLLGGVAQCGGSPQSVSTSFTLQQKDTSSRVRAVSIANNYNRPLGVSKEDIEVEIPPHGTTDRFKNASVIGTWTVRTPLAPDETCDNALDAVRGRLTIRTQMSCEERPDGGS